MKINYELSSKEITRKKKKKKVIIDDKNIKEIEKKIMKLSKDFYKSEEEIKKLYC